MKRWVEALVFVAVAVALHIVAFASQPKSGVASGGSGGDTIISLQQISPTVAEMVETWEAQPQTQPKLNLESLQAPAASGLVVPDLEIETAPQAQVSVALVQPKQEETIEVDTTPPPPPVPEPEPEPEKKAKPETKPKPRPEKPVESEARKAEQTTAGRQEQVSAGSGGTSQAGAGTAKVTAGSPGKRAQLQATWGSKIRARIERNKRYPRGTKAAGQVSINLTVSRSGQLVAYNLTKSSGDPLLDKAAMSAVARARRFPKAPKGLAGESFSFGLKIRLQP